MLAQCIICFFFLFQYFDIFKEHCLTSDTLPYLDTWLCWTSSHFPQVFADGSLLWVTHSVTTQVNTHGAPTYLLALHHGGLSASIHCSPSCNILGRVSYSTHLFSSFWKKKMVVPLLFITACSSDRTLQNCRTLCGNCIALCSNKLPLQVDNTNCLTLSQILFFFCTNFFFCRTVA